MCHKILKKRSWRAATLSQKHPESRLSGSGPDQESVTVRYYSTGSKNYYQVCLGPI